VTDTPELGDLLRQAQAMQEQLIQAQQAAAEQVVQGHAGGGVVTVEVTGGMEFRSVRISPEVVDPNDIEMLEDLVLAALNDAVHQASELSRQAMGGLDIGGLQGLLGG